jgi:hypothetical protein
MKAFRAFTRRAISAIGLVVRDRRIPRPLRWLGGLALLPVPGPFDEAVLLLVAAPLFVFYRRHLRDAWLLADPQGQAGGHARTSRRSGPPHGVAGPTTAEVEDGGR